MRVCVCVNIQINVPLTLLANKQNKTWRQLRSVRYTHTLIMAKTLSKVYVSFDTWIWRAFCGYFFRTKIAGSENTTKNIFRLIIGKQTNSMINHTRNYLPVCAFQEATRDFEREIEMARTEMARTHTSLWFILFEDPLNSYYSVPHASLRVRVND